MRIALIRHFAVNHRFRLFSSSDGFDRDMRAYDRGDIRIDSKSFAGGEWDLCFSSDMKRARLTAARISSCRCRHLPELREVPLRSAFRFPLPLPAFVWAIQGRIQWLSNSRRQEESYRESMDRARKFFLNHLGSEAPDRRVLVISHAIFMICLRRTLFAYGFSGDRIVHYRNGALHEYVNRGINPFHERPHHA